MINSWKRRIVWRLLTWLWIVPVLLFPVAWEVKPMGWVIIGFLVVTWAAGIYWQIRSIRRWAATFEPEALRSAFTIRFAWPVVAQRANLLDNDGFGPEFVAVEASPRGWTATLNTDNHRAELNALENHRGSLRRLLRLERLDLQEMQVGTVQLRGFLSDPLQGIREVIDFESKYKYGIRIGRKEGGGDLALDLTKAAGHIALQGETRSGKSVTSYAFLAQCANDRRVEVWGIDPTGVLLSPWKDQPGKRACGLSDLDQCVTVVEDAIEVMTLRLHDLELQGVDKIEPTIKNPTLLMVLEEWPGTLKALKDGDAGRKTAEKREAQVRSGISRLIAEGAKVGVKVMMIAQRFDASIIGGAERSNIAYRITHRVDNSDAVRMLHPNATDDLIEYATEFPTGRALVQWPAEKPEIVQSDLIEYQDYRARVERGTQLRKHRARLGGA